MIVYGDTSHNEMMGEAVGRLRTRLRRALRASRPSLDELRTLLILAGQLEQAALDAHSADPRSLQAGTRSERLHLLTSRVADAFLSSWLSFNDPDSVELDVHAALDAAARALDAAKMLGDVALHVRTPEGFAHYALYPEQYIEAALAFCAEHARDSERLAIVVGVASIGTTLAAVVARVLALRGFEARAIAIRPTGHPFARRAHIDVADIGFARLGLVVDEGPGLSGSSMAAVGDALVRAGMPRANISFLPGHDGAPGVAASEAVRQWWSTTPRYTAPLARVRLCGTAVPDALAALLPALYGGAAEVERVEDLSAGCWRPLVYSSLELWPAVCTSFERVKLRCTTRGGARYLFKFAGLGCAGGSDRAADDMEAAALKRRADTGLSSKPVITAHGFVATRWIEGRPLTIEDADGRLLAAIGRYLARSAGPRMGVEAAADALARLDNMLFSNAGEALGEVAATRLRQVFLYGVRDALTHLPRAYGDGHMAPHEWLRTPDGEIHKVDCVGHDADHTIIGSQSIAWDIAGAACEWRLQPSAFELLLDAYRSAGGEPIHAAELNSYRLAYAAFRAGQCHLCANIGGADEHERARLTRAFGSYCTELCRAL